MHKYLALVLLLSYIFVLTVLSLVSIGVPNLGSSIDDKIYHFFAHTVLVVLSYNFLVTTSVSRKIITSALIAIVYGIIIEALQCLLTSSRTLDFFDILANFLGAVFAVVLINFTKNLKLK